MNEQLAKRPLITANMVTVARLLPMPVLCWLVYRGELSTALIVGIILGCTDFVDGYLARKHGPTVLGGLLDPIADKVFIAFAYLPFADVGIVPAWAVALMFVREFLVTALRSAYEQRGLTMKTSYFAKVKTWTQMQGIGTLILFLILRDHPPILYALLFTIIIAPLFAMAALWVIKRRFWTGALIMSAATGPFPFIYQHYGNIELVIYVLMLLVVSLTWLSGIDYIAVGMRELRGRGDFARADVVRMLSALALPCLIFAALVLTPMPAWTLVTILAVELAIGGLDNLLSHHRVAAGALAWSVRALGTSLALAAALVANHYGHLASLPWLAVIAALLSTMGVGIEFWRGRDYYVDKRIRAKELQASLASKPV